MSRFTCRASSAPGPPQFGSVCLQTIEITHFSSSFGLGMNLTHSRLWKLASIQLLGVCWNDNECQQLKIFLVKTTEKFEAFWGAEPWDISQTQTISCFVSSCLLDNKMSRQNAHRKESGTRCNAIVGKDLGQQEDGRRFELSWNANKLPGTAAWTGYKYSIIPMKL